MSFRSGLRRSLPYAIAVIGGFLVAYLIVAFFVFPSGVVPHDVRVPNVVGLQYDDAAKQLTAMKLAPARGPARPNEAPTGTVLEQDPVAGTKDVQGAQIQLTVSGGQKGITSPDSGGGTP